MTENEKVQKNQRSLAEFVKSWRMGDITVMRIDWLGI